MKNSVGQGHGARSNPFCMKDLCPSVSPFWKIISDLTTVNSPDHGSFRSLNQRKTLSKRAPTPFMKNEAGQTKPTAHPRLRLWARPLLGPCGWVGDWYLWHAPDGLRARAATGARCMHAGAKKSGFIEASYASAIIRVLGPVSSHRKRMLPRSGFGAGALRDRTVNQVCRDRPDPLCQFAVSSEPAHRPGPTAVRGCRLIDLGKTGRSVCRWRGSCRLIRSIRLAGMAPHCCQRGFRKMWRKCLPPPTGENRSFS